MRKQTLDLISVSAPLAILILKRETRINAAAHRVFVSYSANYRANQSGRRVAVRAALKGGADIAR